MPSHTAIENFKQSPIGRRLRPIIEDPVIVAEMVIINSHGLPPVLALEKRLDDDLKSQIDNNGKRTIGGWIAEVLSSHDLEPHGQRKLPRGSFFGSGALYRKKSGVESK